MPLVQGRAAAAGTTGVSQVAPLWVKPALFRAPWQKWLFIGLALGYLVWATGSVDVNWARVSEGLVRAARFLQGFLAPDFRSRGEDIWIGLQESITMTITATVAGVLLSVPFGLGAARNIAPVPVYFFCRGFIALSRSFQEVLIAIFLVALFGFGPFAGFLTLTVSTIGFLGKLLAEDIEEADPRCIEAIRATGAGWWQVVVYAVWPQVLPRLVGLSVYRFDINFRESAVVGIVGAGGIGGTLNTAMDRYEYDSAAAMLIIIILIVLATEYSSGYIRRRVQ
ncbi:MAG: phosphonate ABC transporter, permease protein PhnE, partial [Betaproteobacteria bacterium]|nr:phosphonate ABC transporter, permease protein PhnE [Betaproteobacteria bacterium]NCX82241.1 phosphonate ABC transporter, permease protein PhnE [Betaproteobacteria bacterium]NDA35367.1 phosphonate ABC transporter, permease protein PhnE [Betaproteobacteria bacterium]NDF77654.1 phosphonate ABC transporter, permease protein PhnE [Betaproteobacteria bacterium]HAB46991.1 phosphonate ABC transporter, permease protein PhnE [Lautropia sp.]